MLLTCKNIMVFHEYFSSYPTIMSGFSSAFRYHLDNFQFPTGLLVKRTKLKLCCEINMEPQITIQSTTEACGFVDCPLPVSRAAGTESYSNTLCKYQACILR